MTMEVRLRDFLDQRGIHYSVFNHARAATAQAMAAATHVSGKAVAKTVILKKGNEPAMVVLPANHAVDLHALGELLGGTVRLAREDELEELFPDCEIGAMSPFGNLYHLPVWVAEPLAEDREIVFNAGTHTEAIRMRYEDFARLVEPHVVRCSHVVSSEPRHEPEW